MAATDRPSRERNPDLPVWIYRGVSAALSAALLAVLLWVGGRILTGVDRTVEDVSAVREKLVRIESRIEDHERRLERVESERDIRWRQTPDTPAGGR